MKTGRKLTVLAVLCSVVSGSALGARARPALKLVDLTPLTLRGTGFQPTERVRLTLTRSERLPIVRSIRAAVQGTFRVRFPVLLAVEPCRSLSVLAAGSKGSRARYTHRCHPPDPALP